MIILSGMFDKKTRRDKEKGLLFGNSDDVIFCLRDAS